MAGSCVSESQREDSEIAPRRARSLFSFQFSVGGAGDKHGLKELVAQVAVFLGRFGGRLWIEDDRAQNQRYRV
jgi:hypothetical protein